VHKGEATEMIDKNSSHLVPLGKEIALVLTNKTSNRRLKLINGDALAWCSSNLECGGLSLGSPWALGGTAEKAGLTPRDAAGTKA
jgi:hypothetical protein